MRLTSSQEIEIAAICRKAVALGKASVLGITVTTELLVAEGVGISGSVCLQETVPNETRNITKWVRRYILTNSKTVAI